jgi:hypothetical protein
MLNLNNVTLIAIDGTGTYKKITKAIQLSKKNINFADVILLSPESNYNNLNGIKLIKIDKLTYVEWNRFVLKELYKYFNTSHYIYVDVDGFIVNSNLWTDDFLKYDYIGAPWKYQEHILTKYVDDFVKRKNPNQVNLVGNGGFTLRSKRLLLETNRCLDDRYYLEDLYICINNYDYFISKGIKFAPIELACIFSQDPVIDINKTFGFHGHKNLIDQFQL